MLEGYNLGQSRRIADVARLEKRSIGWTPPSDDQPFCWYGQQTKEGMIARYVELALRLGLETSVLDQDALCDAVEAADTLGAWPESSDLAKQRAASLFNDFQELQVLSDYIRAFPRKPAGYTGTGQERDVAGDSDEPSGLVAGNASEPTCALCGFAGECMEGCPNKNKDCPLCGFEEGHIAGCPRGVQ